MNRSARWILLACMAVFAAPALNILAKQSWQTEAGSLTPLVLCIGAWSLYQRARLNAHLVHDGSLVVWAMVLLGITPIYALANLIEFGSIMATCVWAGGVATFYALVGSAVVRKCAVPLLLLGLIVPVPYTLSLAMNVALRTWLSEGAVWLGSTLGLSVARESGTIIVNQYVLAVENACAGVNSTLSLVAMGLLFAHWVSNVSTPKAIILALLAVPIALFANLLRVVALMAIVAHWGVNLVDTMLHPLSGVLSFIFALIMVIGLLSVMARTRPTGKRAPAAC